MTEAGPLARRLEAFLTSWATARAPGRTSRLADRLARLFEQARPLLALPAVAETNASEAPTNRLCPEALEATLRCLREPLAQAREAGLFLNVWTTAGLRRDEVRNAAVLASLLDPQRCPATGPALLWALLQRVKWSSRDPLLREADTQEAYVVRTEDYPLGCDDNRVDLSIEGRSFLVFIEVKIDAGEGIEQLARYDNVLREKARLLNKRPALVYLSPRPAVKPPLGTGYVTWADVASAARQVGRTKKSADRSFVSTVLLHFAAHAAQFA